MAYRAIPGTRVRSTDDKDPDGKNRRCLRCGTKRERTGLCADCRYVLSDEEIAAWLGKSTATG